VRCSGGPSECHSMSAHVVLSPAVPTTYQSPLSAVKRCTKYCGPLFPLACLGLRIYVGSTLPCTHSPSINMHTLSPIVRSSARAMRSRLTSAIFFFVGTLYFFLIIILQAHEGEKSWLRPRHMRWACFSHRADPTAQLQAGRVADSLHALTACAHSPSCFTKRAHLILPCCLSPCPCGCRPHRPC